MQPTYVSRNTPNKSPSAISVIAAMSDLDGPLTRSRSQSDVTKEAISITSSAFKEELLGEIKTTIRAEIQPLVERLDRVEHQIQVMSALKTKIADVETSVEFVSRRLDDVYSASLPKLATHVEQVATALALQTLNIDVHRRKWSLTVQGLKGPADEDDTDTRSACVKLAREHLDIVDATTSDFAACHRLSRKADSGIIMRFRDFVMRNLWLSNARFLRGRVDDISISPDLPPVLRSLKTELLQKRKTLAPEEKKRAHIKYLREWPYVELAVGKDRKVQSNVTKETLVKSILGFSPLCMVKEPTN